MVSHDIDRALKYADTVIELKDGEVGYFGTSANYKSEEKK